ncbi:SMI1/KNR4 family protein [Streptomyces sp. NPDC047014]|uniref:SMI1/KNR4 family protein n=1 Tax=Streptomyces sp. NPDC047014 TaxID=3155736 RepID=UPI0033FDD237
MTYTDDREFPAALAAAMSVPFDYADGHGVDFEPYPAFLSAEDTTDWFQAWTGNTELDGDAFRVFGQDGTGGYAAFWLVRPGRPVEEQPVVFLGSEGETGVVARDLADLLWLLADGFGPAEAGSPYATDWTGHPDPARTSLAERHAPARHASAEAVVRQAEDEFPGFTDTITSLCR